MPSQTQIVDELPASDPRAAVGWLRPERVVLPDGHRESWRARATPRATSIASGGSWRGSVRGVPAFEIMRVLALEQTAPNL